jgi:hypothetical protein
MNSIDSINGMTHAEATKLRRARVRTTTTFLQIASTRSGRALLTKETGINSPKLLHWARRAELMQIKNLGKDYADLLEAVGVESVSDLKRRNPEALLDVMQKRNSKNQIVDRMPSLKKVTSWIEDAGLMEIKVSS